MVVFADLWIVAGPPDTSPEEEGIGWTRDRRQKLSATVEYSFLSLGIKKKDILYFKNCEMIVRA